MHFTGLEQMEDDWLSEVKFGLYHLSFPLLNKSEMPDQISSSTALVHSSNSNPHIWHLRLGHVPSERLQKISNLDSSIKTSQNHV